MVLTCLSDVASLRERPLVRLFVGFNNVRSAILLSAHFLHFADNIAITFFFVSLMPAPLSCGASGSVASLLADTSKSSKCSRLPSLAKDSGRPSFSSGTLAVAPVEPRESGVEWKVVLERAALRVDCGEMYVVLRLAVDVRIWDQELLLRGQGQSRNTDLRSQSVTTISQRTQSITTIKKSSHEQPICKLHVSHLFTLDFRPCHSFTLRRHANQYPAPIHRLVSRMSRHIESLLIPHQYCSRSAAKIHQDVLHPQLRISSSANDLSELVNASPDLAHRQQVSTVSEVHQPEPTQTGEE